MDINERTFLEVRCRQTKNGFPCRHYMGYFDCEGPAHFSVYYCRNCSTTYIYQVDEFGIVKRQWTKKEMHLKTQKSVAVVEHA